MEAYINLTGNVGTDVEVSTGDNWQYARFRLACTPRVRRQGDWMDAETTWVAVSCSGRVAENVAKSVVKGDPVIVLGRLRTHSWRDENDVRYERLVVEAINVGHDLSRGSTVFSRNEPAKAKNGGEGQMGQVEQQTKNQIAGEEIISVAA